jgi:glycosyltransferase involved in cell wall biosynthesis
MRVTLVNSFFPPWRGGAETYSVNLARALAGRGHEVTVQCGSDPLPGGVCNEFGIRIVRHRILMRVYGTPVMPGLLKALTGVKSDVLHGNFPSPYIACAVAAASRSRRIPAVLTWHNDLPPVTSGAKFLIQAHDRIVLPCYITAYRRVISTSAYYAEHSRILSSLGEKVRVVPNGVDCDRFHPSRDGGKVREELRLGDRFTIIFVGALTKWHRYKGLEVLLHAIRSLPRELNLVLIIVGDGELKGHYMMMSHDLGLDGRVIFMGDVDDAELPQIYVASHVSILPSKDMSEGFGLTLLEANASGLPVIASRVGGIPSVVKDGYNGILVPPNEPQALAEAILSMIKNPREVHEMGRNGRRFAETHDWRRTAAETEDVYKEVLA